MDAAFSAKLSFALGSICFDSHTSL